MTIKVYRIYYILLSFISHTKILESILFFTITDMHVFNSCMLHLEVPRLKTAKYHPQPDSKFFVDLNGLGILRDAQ